MCGIVGLLAREAISPATLGAVELMHHRGPDSSGEYVHGRIGFAMRRLAIIDLATGDQPIASEAGDIVCIANCEIYNYRELTRELEAAGHSFRTSGDVEVIVHAYEQYGDACFERFRGMFATAIWDGRRERLVLARDRFGIKPLYLAETPQGFAFASEIAPLLALGADGTVDLQAVADYLSLGYVPGEATGLRGVRRLLPGRLLVHEGGSLHERPFWTPEPLQAELNLEETLTEAVRLHLRSDVPLAVLLSGGLDSSLIAALAAAEVDEPLRTFTVGFQEAGFDEREHARAVAEAVGSRHRELVVEPDIAEDLPEIVSRLEQPLADSSAIPLYYVCRAVAEEVKVALAGDGGDEVFGGYSRYAWDPLAARVGRALPARALAAALEGMPGVRRQAAGAGRKNVIRRAVKLLRSAELPEARRYFSWFALLTDDARAELLGNRDLAPTERIFERLFEEAPSALEGMARLQDVDLRTMLADDLMLKADKLSMAHSLELRVPFLDHEVVAAGLFLPDREKVRGVRTKVAIRRLVAERLPPAIAKRPKQGFEVPINRWLRGELRDLAGDVLSGDGIDGLLDRAASKRLLDLHVRGKVDAGAQLYALTVLGIWREGLAARAGTALSTVGKVPALVSNGGPRLPFVSTWREFERGWPPRVRLRRRARHAALGALRSLPVRQSSGIRIVHYHYVFDDERESFARQLEFFARDFEPVLLSEAVERLREGRVRGNELAITFDDGFRNQLENAAPLLAEHGFGACFFLITGLVSAPRNRVEELCRERLHLPRPVEPLTWGGVERLIELGHEIGSHTHTHPNLAALPPDDVEEELRVSHDELERRLGTRVSHFSAPYGDRERFSPAIGTAARAAGYESCCSAQRGRNAPGADPYQLRRDHLLAHWPIEDLRYFLQRA